jgi:2,3-bisphosphoglycerate-independent phosphoglycerate mutase
MALIMILLDGVGIAPAQVSDPVRRASALFRPLHAGHPVPITGDGWAIPTRADLDVPGLPQSATGHTTLLTGINAARVLGRHFPGFPTITLKNLLRAENILMQLTALGLRASYVNAYRPIMPIAWKRRLMSATTVAALANGQVLRGLEDLLEGRALHHDFTNGLLVAHGEDLPRYTPRHAGRLLAKIARDQDFTLYEYFLTDMVGHTRDPVRACKEVEKVDRFLTGLLEDTDLRTTHVLVCSDHGNLEDPSVRTHTMNPVPTILWGPRSAEMIGAVKGIEHIAPAVLDLLQSGNGHAGGAAG